MIRPFINFTSGVDENVSGRKGLFRLSSRFIALSIAVLEATTIALGGFIADVASRGQYLQHPTDFGFIFGPSLVLSAVYVSVARASGLYYLPALINPGRHAKAILKVCGVVLLSFTAMLFLLKIGSSFSRVSSMEFATVMLVFCCLGRATAAAVVGRLLDLNAIDGRPTFLVGEAAELSSLTRTYLLRQFGLREVGRVVLAEDSHRLAGNSDGLREAINRARSAKAKEFLVASGLKDRECLSAIEVALRSSPLPVKVIPNEVFRTIIGRHASPKGASAYLIELQRAPMAIGEQVAKRSVDIFCSSLAILLLLPLFVLIAGLIRLDSPGPVIFRQRRNGFDQRQFVIFKFRTMSVLEDAAVVTQAQRVDRRVTRVGRVLRRLSIDELPQLFNVLIGNMSLVGPRPHALAHDIEYSSVVDDYFMRHHVKPGITGWAQINGLRGQTLYHGQMQRRVEFDLWYIKNWSVLLDFQILFRTLIGVFGHDAY